MDVEEKVNYLNSLMEMAFSSTFNYLLVGKKEKRKVKVGEEILKSRCM